MIFQIRGAALTLMLLLVFQSAFAQPANLNITIAGGAAYTTSQGVTLALSADNTTASTNCSLSNDNSAWSDQAPYAASATWNLTAGDGSKSVYYRCTDDGANWTPSVSSSIILDTAPPNITSVSPTNNSVATSVRPSISASVSDAGSGINSSSTVLLIDGSSVSASYSSGTVSYAPTSDLSEANHSISLTVHDNVGTSASTSWSFKIDKPPLISSPSPAGGDYVKTSSPTISAILSDSGTGINPAATVMKVDNVTGNTTYSSGTLSYAPTLADGVHSVTVQAFDYSGVSASLTWNFTIDKIEPQFGAPVPPANSEQNTVASISIPVSDAVSGLNKNSLKMKVDSKDVTGQTAFASGVFYYLPNKLSGGNHTVEVWADDNAGNSAFLLWTFSIFSKEPLVNSFTPASGQAVNSTTPLISAKITDSGTSGLDLGTPRIYLDGTDVSSGAEFDEASGVISYAPPSALSQGNHTAEVKISDKIGNTADKSWTFIVDTMQPGKPEDLAVTVSGTTATLSWSAASGAVSYRIYRSSSQITSVSGLAKLGDASGTSYSDASASGKFYYAVVAVDAAGNQGEPAFAGTCAKYENGWVVYGCCRDSDCSTDMQCNLTSHACNYPEGYVSKLDAETRIDDVRAEMDLARGAGKNVSIAEELLNSSADAYNAGNYSFSVNLAEQAHSALQTAPMLSQQTGSGKKPFPGCGGSGAILLALMSISIYYSVSRRLEMKCDKSNTKGLTEHESDRRRRVIRE